MSRTSDAGNRLTRAGLAAFLDALAETGMVCEAATRAGVPRASLYRRKAADADFAAEWAAALEAGLDRLRDEAVRRAYQGVEETVWYRGEPVGTVRRYSDQLLMFLLRAHQPAVYREPRAGAGAAERAAEKAALRTADEQDRLVADAYELGKGHGLGEILALIDGGTRRIRDGKDHDKPSSTAHAGSWSGNVWCAGGSGGVPATPDTADAAPGETAGTIGAGDDRNDDTGDAAAGATRGDIDGMEPGRPRALGGYVPVEVPDRDRYRNRTVDYDPFDPHPRNPP